MKDYLPQMIEIQAQFLTTTFKKIQTNGFFTAISMKSADIISNQILITKKHIQDAGITLQQLYRCIYFQYIHDKGSKQQGKFITILPAVIIFIFTFTKTSIKQLAITIESSQNPTKTAPKDNKKSAHFQMQQFIIFFQTRIDCKVESACSKLQQSLKSILRSLQQQAKKVYTNIEAYSSSMNFLGIEEITSNLQTRFEELLKAFYEKQNIELDLFKHSFNSDIGILKSDFNEIMKKIQDIHEQLNEKQDDLQQINNKFNALFLNVREIQHNNSKLSSKINKDMIHYHNEDHILSSKQNISEAHPSNRSFKEDNPRSPRSNSSKNSSPSSDKQFFLIKSQKPCLPQQLTTYQNYHSPAK